MNWRRGRHLDDEALARLVDAGGGVELLSPEGQRHLRICPRCTGLLEGHRRARRLLLRADPPAALPTPSFGARSVNVRPQFAVSAGGLLVVAIAVVVIGRGSLGPSAATPSAQGGASASPSGQPSAVASPATVGEWKILAASDVADADWSPDGRWLIIWDDVVNGAPQDHHLRLDDAQGNLVRTLDGDRAIWLDAGSFVLVRSGASFLGTVDSDALTPISGTFPKGVVSNGHGALAYASGAPDAAEQYVVWTRDGTSDPRPGRPLAWSRDGSRLAVWHRVDTVVQTREPSGWLEVVGWPDLRPIAAVRDQAVGAIPAPFDPSGRYLPFFAGRLYVLDLTTGSVRAVGPAGASNQFAWDRASNLVIADGNGSVTIYDVGGASLGVETNVGDSVTASADGSTVALYFSQGRQQLVLLGDGEPRSITAPGPVQPEPRLSPDGSKLVVVCAVGSGVEVLLLTK